MATATQSDTLLLQAQFEKTMKNLHGQSAATPARQKPIFRKQSEPVERTLSNAANALAALWKVR
jgi:hypothetical protein